jgi:flagellar biosynthesis protein FlhF
MKSIKKYTGNDMNEILDRIRTELGEDAVILKSSSRNKPMNGGSRFEVVAGLEETVETPAVAVPGHAAPAEEAMRQVLAKIRRESAEKKTKIENVRRPLPAGRDSENIVREIKDLRVLLSSIFPQAGFSEPEAMRKIRSHLLNNGAKPQAVDRLIHSMSRLLGDRTRRVSQEQCLQVARALIEKELRKKCVQKTGVSRRIRVLAGPTGAGKTTTLAKWASRTVFEEKKDVVLVSLDSYRLGAQAQLKAYADILSVPFFAAESGDQLSSIVSGFSPETQIFIDTSGLSPMNGIGIRKLAALLSPLDDCAVYLVISAVSRIFEIKNILSHFEVTGFEGVILTKIDELGSFGHLLSLPNLPVKTIKYLTNGQEVPKDMMIFSPSFLASKILQVD